MAARIDQINSVVGFPEKVKNVPPNYPTVPGPGKISLLWQYNKENLWHRFSPYTQGDNIFGIFPNKQPFVYRYPDEAQNSTFNRLPAVAKTLATATNVPRVIDDAVRVGKFLVSPQGVLYNIKQFGIQRLNSFDETRLYNPLSPLLATIQPATLGIGLRPRRHIEGGFLGLLNSLTSTVGIDLTGGKFQTPSSTVGTPALPDSNIGQGKGLIRGGDAASGMLLVNNKWGANTAGLTGLTSLFKSIKDTFNTYFGAPNKSDGTYRADEDTFSLMLSYYNKGETKVKYYPTDNIYDKTAIFIRDTKFPEFVKDNTGKFPTNDNNKNSQAVRDISDSLKLVLSGLSTNINYQSLTNTYSRLLSSGDPASFGYEYLNRVTSTNGLPPRNTPTPKSYGVISEYASTFGGPKTLDKSTSTNNIRMATSFTSDALNQIGVIGKDKKFEASKEYPNYTEYKPYEDDLIAFFFYDVVNQKYIPFRATVKGISEGGTAFWDELRFIGRADQLYSYNGFSRTLSFTFNIVISSLTELLPTWQNVNYMASAVKPSNYTTGEETTIKNRYSKFIVPPMFMLTIGDMYKFQPIVITSINVNVPDDASWETLTGLNSKQWSYLNGIIRAPNIGSKYAQLPREMEIAVTCNLLEKERAIIGGSHFGHAPRKDTFGTIVENPDGQLVIDDTYVEGGEEYLPAPTEFSKNMLSNNLSSVMEITDEDRASFANRR
jgi:hypothetical protein